MKRSVILLLSLIGLLMLSGCGKKQPAGDTVEPLSVKQVTSLLYRNSETTLRFTCDKDKWTWVDGEGFPLDDSTIKEILARLLEIASAEPESKGTDLSACGLAEPTRFLTVGSDEGERTIYFGTQAANGMWYMRPAESDKVYLISDEFVQLLEKNIYDMTVLPALPELTEENMTFIGVTKSEENYTYLLHADGTWKYNGKDVAATAKRILKELDGMTLTRCVDYFPAAGVSELCGLTEGATTVTLKYLNSVGSESELVLTVGTLMESGEGYYLTMGDSDAVYCLPQHQLSTLLSLLE